MKKSRKYQEKINNRAYNHENNKIATYETTADKQNAQNDHTQPKNKNNTDHT